jgi:hypothetical protein
MITVNHIDIDFIAYCFLYEIDPQPDMFELKQLLAIPYANTKAKNNIEERHEFMLSVIRDRIDNADKYEKERFSKYGEWYYYKHRHNKRYHGKHKHNQQPLQPRESYHKSEKIVKGCKHTIQEVQKLEQLIEQRAKQKSQEVLAKYQS